MGRRAKKAPVQTKKKVKLSAVFKCPFCASNDTVECKMDRKASIGSLTCRLCGAAYQMPIHHLHEPIDVFSEWLDDCEAAAKSRDNTAEGTAAAPQYDDEDDEEDDLPEPGLARPAASQKPAASSNNQKAIDLGMSSDEDDDDE